jgi:chitin disaccharide deacetylase
MKNIVFPVMYIFCWTSFISAQPSIQEKLGYPKDAKLLIIHADDLGVAHSENEASINALEKGPVNSASIMVPTPWFSEIAAYAAAHPKADFGLHLTLTSEWKYYKWGPLSETVPGLKNKEGFFFASADSVHRSATIAEVEKELRMQIEKANQFGIDVTHFDSHMGTLFGRPDYLKLYIQLGREYKVPVMIPGEVKTSLGSFITDKDVLVDAIHTASPGNFKNGMDKYYAGVLESLKPGLSVLLIHTAYDDKEMQSITIDHPDWGAGWRQADYNFFTSDNCKKILRDKNIRLVTWREIRDKLVR